jgi:uncharacterized protein YqhQ
MVQLVRTTEHFLGENLVVAPQIQHCVTGLLRYILYLIYIFLFSKQVELAHCHFK